MFRKYLCFIALLFFALHIRIYAGFEDPEVLTTNIVPEVGNTTNSMWNKFKCMYTTQECEYVSESTNNFSRLKQLEKPKVFSSWAERLDYIHNNLTYDMQGYVDQADSLFQDDSIETKPIPESYFQLGLYSEVEDNKGISFRLSPDINADIKIPNIEERLRLFIDTKNSDDLPGTTVMERESGFNAGLRKVTKLFRFDAGIKIRLPPVLFGRVDWRQDWYVERWKIYPLGRIYWESDDGYGLLTSISAHRYIGKRILIKSITAAKWTEKSNSHAPRPPDYPPDEYYETDAGVEWEQSLAAGYISKVMRSKDIGSNLSLKNVAEATGLRLSLFGNTERVGGIERVRLSLGHRRPIYKNWIFLMITPEVEWRKEDDWLLVPKIRVGIDMLFSVSGVESSK